MTSSTVWWTHYVNESCCINAPPVSHQDTVCGSDYQYLAFVVCFYACCVPSSPDSKCKLSILEIIRDWKTCLDSARWIISGHHHHHEDNGGSHQLVSEEDFVIFSPSCSWTDEVKRWCYKFNERQSLIQ